MRAVSFLDKIEYEFVGNILQDAICLGDVDNDENIELVAASLNGDIAVFKFQQQRPWATASDLGAVASVVVGDIVNDSRNKVLSISCDGWCHIFDLQQSPEEGCRKMSSFHSQRLPANTKMALLADINDDGKTELILCLTDRVVRTYHWVSFPEEGDCQGKLVGLQKWEFANQIGTISLNPVEDNGMALLVAQPGGTYTRLDFKSQKDVPDGSPHGVTDPCGQTLQHHKLGSSHMRNPNVSSSILGGIRGTQGTSLMALATLDGTLMLVDGDSILWSLQVDHQLFALTKLDIVGDGRDEVVACAWDGQTYIVNEERQSVRFQFDEAVSTFTAGELTLSPGVTLPCLVYATFGNRIVVYYNVTFPTLGTHTLLEETQLLSMLKEVAPDASLTHFLDWVMYGSSAYLNTPHYINTAESNSSGEIEEPS
ncbi:KICSTOR complex protein ITFG2-like [Ornithodoros turicata]|uniref:KICSTOR complex protein ITFG2-like n=1 Tax=Ornithodoros turicata TaxID=34597 RepID=UPI003139626C